MRNKTFQVNKNDTIRKGIPHIILTKPKVLKYKEPSTKISCRKNGE